MLRRVCDGCFRPSNILVIGWGTLIYARDVAGFQYHQQWIVLPLVLTAGCGCRHETFVEMVRDHLQGDKNTANGRSSSNASLSSMNSQRTVLSKPADMPVYGSRDKL